MTLNGGSVQNGMTQATTAAHPPCSLRRILPRLGLLLLLTLPGIAQAQFTYETNNGAITITGYTGPGGNVTIPSTINGLPVTAIGDSAFAENGSLTHVTIPGSVTNIGDGAFYYCPGLRSVTIPGSVANIGAYAFGICNSLTNVTISNGVASIGDGAFYGCDGLGNFSIPQSVTNIGTSAFLACNSLTAIAVDTLNLSYRSVNGVLFNRDETLLVQFPTGKTNSHYTIADSVTTIGASAFAGCHLSSLTIGNGVTDIQDHAFADCSDLTSVAIGNSVTNIGQEAFTDCWRLTSIALPDSMTSISDGVFAGCGLTNVTIPGSVTTIGDGAFAYCGLTIVTISNGVARIGDNAFYYCYNLTNFSIPQSVTNIGTSAFGACHSLTAIAVDTLNLSYRSVDGVLFNRDETVLVQFPTGKTNSHYTIADSVTTIGASAFAGCHLSSIAIGNGVTTIGENAFYDCYNLTNVTIPGGVTSIGGGAFYGCSGLSSVSIPNLTRIEPLVFAYTGLTNVTIPSSVTNIGDQAFHGSTLGSVTIPGNVTTIGAYAFGDCGFLTSVTISNGVASIGENAFYYCYSLTNFLIPQSVTNIGTSAFGACNSLTAIAVDTLNLSYRSVDGILFNRDETVLVQFPTGKTNSHYTIADSVTTIGASAFAGCHLSSIAIGNGVTTIGAFAFAYCDFLTSVAVGNSLTNIGHDAFRYCGLNSIALPASLTSIGDGAFAYCSVLHGVVFGGDAPILGGSYVFHDSTQTTVYYLSGTSGWGPTFGDRPTGLWSLAHPLIISHPTSTTIDRGTTINFAVTAIGRSALSYQWKHRGVNLSNDDHISGANTATLTLNNAQLSDSGYYAVMVSDSAGSIISQAARLVVSCGPTNEGEPFVIRSFAGDTNGSFKLVWDSCGCNLYEVQTSEHALNPTNWMARALMIGEDRATAWSDSSAAAPDQRFYRVRRYSPAGDEDRDGLSNLLEFNWTDLHNPETDGDKMPDGWEAQYGLNPLDLNDGYLDLDGDGYSNLQEYRARTRPNASYSHPADLPRALSAWWKLDEGMDTNVLDTSPNVQDGYLMGGDPAGAWTAGYFSNALTLGGPANNWVQVPYRPSLTPYQELTLMGWVKPFGQGVLIGNWDSGQVSGNYRLRFAPDDVELWFSPSGDGSYSTVRFNPNWSTSDWHHLAARYSNGTNLTVLVDGEERGSQNVTAPFVPVPNPILIGFPGLAGAFSVDDVRLYNRALSTAEIAALSRGNGLPVNMIVGQTATLRAFGASDGDTCQWSVASGQGFFTNTGNLTTEFRPSWSGTARVQVVYGSSGLLHTNLSSTTVAFPALSPIAEWNQPNVQWGNNCYNFATDNRTDTWAQPGGPPYYYRYTCELQTSAAISDGLQAGVDLGDLCHTSGLPSGHIVALLIWPDMDFHYLRLEANGMWSSKAGTFPATTLDNSGQPIADPRTANFAPYQFCRFFWVGPDVNILHDPH